MKAKNAMPREERVSRGQGAALGDTGDGDTGVRADEQGISNRPGDLESAPQPASDDGHGIVVVDESENDPDEDELEDEDESAAEEDEEDELNDPEAEPGNF
jgi:hypothetical protein